MRQLSRDKDGKCGCQVGKSPLREDLDELLKAGSPYGEIRQYLIDSNAPVLPRYALSNHSRKCLGLEPRQSAARGTAAKVVPETPELKNVQDLALALFYQRLKESPKEVSTRELVQVLLPRLRKKANAEEETDDLDDILSRV